ncbi:MAG TPA: FliM/FliN family flagellar motor switch protein, partial [Bryobacteraceae bacterium]|nr:FliM/FliN family flagellar motor switch protein [Bryobacteraceae bacterium]
ITEIEQVLLDGLFRLILRDLGEAWKFVTHIDFTIDAIETEPQFLQILAPTEAVVAAAIEIRIGDSTGMMNIAMPSIIIKMMRQKLDQQWFLRKSGSTDHEQSRVLDLIRTANLNAEVVLTGPRLLLRDLINLEPGDVVSFEYPSSRPVDLTLNGQKKFRGEIVDAGRRAAFSVVEPFNDQAS